MNWSARRHISNKHQLDIFFRHVWLSFFPPLWFFLSHFCQCCCCWSYGCRCFVLTGPAAGIQVLVSWQLTPFVSLFIALWLLRQSMTQVHCLVYCGLRLSSSSPSSFSPIVGSSCSASFISLQTSSSSLSPFHLLLILFLSSSVLSFCSFCSFPPSPSPHNHLPPPLPLAKVHVINQTKMRLCLRLAMVESYI